MTSEYRPACHSFAFGGVTLALNTKRRRPYKTPSAGRSPALMSLERNGEVMKMIKALKCENGMFRIDHESGNIEVFDDLEELRQYYDIIGWEMGIVTFAWVERKEEIK